MTPIDKKINKKVAAKAANAAILLTVAAGFGYYSETGPWLHRALDSFGLIVLVAAAITSLREAWALHRTPAHIRYLAAIQMEFGTRKDGSIDFGPTPSESAQR